MRDATSPTLQLKLHMKNKMLTRIAAVALLAFLSLAQSAWAQATVNLYARLVCLNPLTGTTQVPPTDGSIPAGFIPMWGFSLSPDTAVPASVPGPRIDVNSAAGGLVINVYNQLSTPISLVIPGLNGSVDVGQPVKFDAADANYPGRIRSLVPEVPAGGSRQYRWNGPLKLGTYGYHSGSHLTVQVQMGLYGMLVVRRNSDNLAYPGYVVPNNRDTTVIFSEIDPALHWAVYKGEYGPGKTISSTMHSDPSIFLINGRAANPANLNNPAASLTAGRVGQRTLFRMANFCWDSRIPTLAGPRPANQATPSSGAHYLTIIAEDGNLYPYPQTAYAPNLASLKTMDALFTPTQRREHIMYDHRLGLSNPDSAIEGGMFAYWNVVQ